MKRVLPILLLGLIGCTAAPSNQSSNPSTATQSAPQSVTANPTVSPQPREATSAQADKTAPETTPEKSETESAPESSQESSQAEPEKSETADRSTQSDKTPIDEASDRTRRLETMRQMDNPDVERLRNVTSYRNRNWTIKIGSTQPWSGVNNTGSFTYEGCDVNGKCLSLTDGTASCRDGVCSLGWQNGEYFYSLQSPMTEEGQPTPSSTLKVFKGDRMILEETGLTASR